jgi:hypothetical protein
VNRVVGNNCGIVKFEGKRSNGSLENGSGELLDWRSFFLLEIHAVITYQQW